MARGWPITAAIVQRAQVRAALQDLAGNFDSRLAGIVTLILSPAAWIFGNAARLLRFGLMPGGPPVGGPLPDVADHVVDAVAVRRKGRDRRGALESILAEIPDGEIALPCVRHVLAAGRKRIAPGIFLAVETAARREFPLGFRRQILVRPLRVSERIAVRHMNDGVIVEPLDVALGPIGSAPVGVLHETPP